MKWDFAFQPKWGGTLKIFSRHNAFPAAGAGVTAGCGAILLAAAFAIALEVKPKDGSIAP